MRISGGERPFLLGQPYSGPPIDRTNGPSHWPRWSRPDDLADLLGEIARRA